ncbi:chronophin [Drosophila ananassae]|uniref:chronophin n=1 Tax=Drosophila ananassae TaxID=7217 RepID=UPI0013A5C083|nr:chronophin [Drosophila ananassae]
MLVSTQESHPQHILHLSEEQQKKFLGSFDRVVSDIDGVIWNMYNTIPGAPEAFVALEKTGKELTFVTNNSVRTVEQAVRHFEKIGMSVRPEQITHPSQNTVDYLRQINFQGLIYIIASPPFKAVLREAGFQLIDGPNEIIDENFQSLAKKIFDQQPVNAVIIDVDFNMSSTKLLRAQLYLRNPECLFMEGATDRFLPIGKGVNIIGPGAFTNILLEASGRKPITVGKPGRELGKLLVEKYKIDQSDRVLMVGDMMAQDIVFGRQCGFQTLLVLSGGCTLEQLRSETDPSHIPDYYADSLADVAQILGQSRKSHF